MVLGIRNLFKPAVLALTLGATPVQAQDDGGVISALEPIKLYGITFQPFEGANPARWSHLQENIERFFPDSTDQELSLREVCGKIDAVYGELLGKHEIQSMTSGVFAPNDDVNALGALQGSAWRQQLCHHDGPSLAQPSR